MKKFCILMAAIFMIGCVNVSAAPAAPQMSVEQENCIVTVSIDVGEDKPTSILLKSIDEQGNIIYLDDRYTGNDGLYECEFNAENAQGKIRITANVVGKPPYIWKEVLVRTTQMEADMVNLIKNPTPNASGTIIQTDITQKWDALGLDDTVLNGLADQSKVYEFMARDEQNRNASVYNDFVQAFYKAVVIQKYAEIQGNSQSKNDICAVLSNEPYKTCIGSAYAASYDGITQTVKEKIALDMDDAYTNSKEFCDDIEFSLIKNAIQYSALWTDLKPVLENYKSKIGIQRAITTNDCKLLIGKSYNTYGDILLALQGTVGGGSAGGSSSGGGISAPVVKPPVKEPEVQPEEVKKGESVFSDMENYKWAEPYVQHVYELGIVSGYGDGRFCPGQKVTRAEAVKMLTGLIESGVMSDVSPLPFKDVKTTDWSYPYIAFAYKNNIVKGMSADYFGATQNVTRQEAAVMSWTVMQALGLGEGSRLTFNDSDEIASWAKDAVEIIGGRDVIHGRTTADGFKFDPRADLTRAEMAVIISNIHNLL